MRNLNFMATLLLAIIFIGCKHMPSPKDMLHRELHLPNIDSLEILYGKTDSAITLHSNNPKIVSYYNLAGCMSCRLKELRNWRCRIMELEHSNTLNADFIFLFRADSDNEHFMEEFRQTGFNHTVLLDTDGEFERLNELPKDSRYHTFLLDNNNRIILVGSPVYNAPFWERYKTRIKECNTNNRSEQQLPPANIGQRKIT